MNVDIVEALKLLETKKRIFIGLSGNFPDLKNIDLDTAIVILNSLDQKLWSKTKIVQNGGQHNTFKYISCQNCQRYFF